METRAASPEMWTVNVKDPAYLSPKLIERGVCERLGRGVHESHALDNTTPHITTLHEREVSESIVIEVTCL